MYDIKAGTSSEPVQLRMRGIWSQLSVKMVQQNGSTGLGQAWNVSFPESPVAIDNEVKYQSEVSKTHLTRPVEDFGCAPVQGLRPSRAAFEDQMHHSGMTRLSHLEMQPGDASFFPQAAENPLGSPTCPKVYCTDLQRTQPTKAMKIKSFERYSSWNRTRLLSQGAW